MSADDSTSSGDVGGDDSSSHVVPSPSPVSVSLSNGDFRNFLQSNPTNTHTNNKPTNTHTKLNDKEKHGEHGESKPSAPPPSSTTSQSTGMKYADGETRTVKITRHGIENANHADSERMAGEDEADGHHVDDSAHGDGHPPKKGAKVLSSRERSYLAFQQKQALKAEAKNRYRDRAKERALGINPDYNDADIATSDLSVEASKYLGGDLAHTHLVKGLDYALMNKVREEIEREEENKFEQMIEERAKGGATSEIAPVPSATGASRPTSSTKRSASASAIYSILMAPPPQPRDVFLPGRMMYSFPLQTHGSMGDNVRAIGLAQSQLSALPTTQLTSHSDLAEADANWSDDHIRLHLPQPLWTKVVDLFVAKRAADEERRRQRKLRMESSGGYNVTKEDHAMDEIETEQMERIEAKKRNERSSTISISSKKNEPSQPSTTTSSSTGASASTSAATPGELDYSVPRPPPVDDSDDDDDDIFAGAGSDYVAKIEPTDGDGMDTGSFDVPRPPPSDDEESEEPTHSYAPASESPSSAVYGAALPPPSPSAAAPAVAKPLFASDPSIRQLDKFASRIPEEDEDEDDDIFVSSTAAGDELLGNVADEKNLTDAERRKRKAAAIADEEYAELFPDYHAGFSATLDEDEDMEEDDKPSKKFPPDSSSSSHNHGKGGKTPLHRGGVHNEAKDREKRFNAEFSQVTQMLQARGVKLNDDQRRRQTNPAKEVDDERAIKRQKILKGFAKK